jgi:Rps23 Pro-64 3,4-dihydroxylase Tpa1-like proline 4-hydroxylase
MEGNYYKENLYDINHLKTELDEIYELSTQIERYTKTIHRGAGHFGSMETHESYDKAKAHMDMITYWYKDNANDKIGQLCLNGGELEWSDYPNTYNWIIDKSFELFKEECKHKSKLFMGKPLLTLYTKGCLLNGHNDGKPDGYEEFPNQKAANILLYLNKEYKKESGGLFIVDNEEVVPNFADIVFLNFSGDSDPYHEVSKVVEDVNRFALLFNVQYNR